MFDYEIFDKGSIALGLLAALLAAQCIILYIKVQAFRGKLDSSIEDLMRDERAKFDSRRLELEAELKERAIRLESEYASLISDVKKANDSSQTAAAEAEADRIEARLSLKRVQIENSHFQKLKNEYETLVKEYTERLGKLANIDSDGISAFTKAEIEKQSADDLNEYRGRLFKESAEDIEAKAKAILADVIQRSAVSRNAELNSALVRIPNEAMKGRLIGKDGRNIRCFESVTETTLVIDETPDSVMISSFDPGKREIAKVALEYLLKDGRINPASIESAVASAKSEVEKMSFDMGLSAADQLGIKRLHPDIIRQLGRLRLHMSLNQNTLEHSIECARIASLLASELSCDPNIAKRAALLHDIGKVSDSDLPHAQAGAEFLRRYNESEAVLDAVESHHDESFSGNIYGAIVRIADSISATRPGARMVPSDGYFARVKTLEDIALSFKGVVSAYALQAGRELRIIVEPDTVDDALAQIIAGKVREKISEKLDISVPVKIILIREKRFVETASGGRE